MNHITEVVEDNEEDQLLIASETMGQDLMGLIVQEIKALPDVWQKLAESRQAEVLDRIQKRVEDAIRSAVGIISSAGLVRVSADIEGVAIKDKIKATLIISRANDSESLQTLFNSHNQPCLILMTGAEQFTGGMGDFEPDKDQPGLPLDESPIQGEDALYVDAVQFVVESRKASISAVQRHLRVGYNRAARLIEVMEERGVVSAANHSGVREVLVPASEPEQGE